MRKVNFIGIVAVLFLSGCEKREYPPEQVFLEKEVFSVNAIVNGQTIELKAGEEYYCYSSYAQSNGVYQLSGELRKVGCDTCGGTFRLKINDVEERAANAAVPVDVVLAPGGRPFQSPLDQQAIVSFTSSFNKPAISWLWDFGDGFSSTVQHPQHNFAKAGKFDVCVTARTSSGCESTVCKTLQVLNNGHIYSASVEAQVSSDRTVDFNGHVVGGKPPYSYHWFFGDGRSGNGQIRQHRYDWPGSYAVKLVATDSDGRECTTSYNYVSESDLSSCATNFEAQQTGFAGNTFSTVVVEWVDESGERYSSDKVDQPETSYFEIVESSEFKPNEKGEKTRKVHTRMNVLLSNGSQSIWLKSDEAVLAVAHP